MTKKITTISIEENILKKAKKEIPNLSIWVEDGLKAYFGVNDTDLMVIDENRQYIRDCMLKIHLASKKTHQNEVENKLNAVEMDKAWKDVWRKYRAGQSFDLKEASESLNLNPETLQDLLGNLDLSVSRADWVKCEDWKFAREYL